MESEPGSKDERAVTTAAAVPTYSWDRVGSSTLDSEEGSHLPQVRPMSASHCHAFPSQVLAEAQARPNSPTAPA